MCVTIHKFSVLVMNICPGGGTYWRLLLCIISVPLSWFPQAVLKAPEETSHPPYCSSCVSSHVPWTAPSGLFPSHTGVCGSTLPFPTLAVFAATLCNFPQPSPVCSAASDPLDSCLQLHLSPRVRMEETVCQQHLRQQGFLTILGSPLC